MNDTKIASKAKAQFAHFMGKVFTRFSKPAKKFIEECIYGIQASGDTKLSSIVRAIDDIRPIYTEKRLSRNLDDETLEASVAETVLRDGARSYTTEGASGIRNRGRHKAGVHPLRKVGAHGGEGNRGETRNGDDAAASGLRRTFRRRRRIATSDAKRRKPHPETHFSLYLLVGCDAFPRSKNG